MEVPASQQQQSSEHQSFRHNFQAWVDSNYGEHSRTKTITRTKYTKICRYLMGEEVETDAKFRFWVKSKAFRILRHQLDPNIGVLCVPVSVSGVKGQNTLTGFDTNGNHQAFGLTEYRQVAVVDDFYSIIRSVHITERGVHVGQKKTYRAVSQTYAFLPREAVSYFLMSCNHCKLRIQTSNSILVKHGVPPVHVDSDQEDLTDGEGSVSSNDKDFESDMPEEPVRKRVKKEKIDNDYIHENGMDILDKFDTSPEDSEQENGNGDPEYVPNGKSMMKGEIGMMQQGNLDSALDMGISALPKKLNSSGAAMMGKALTRTTRRGGGGGRRLSYSPETDKQLLEWVVERSRNGLPVSREAIQTQALALVRDECPDFKASSGWVEKFLIRHKISLPTRASMLENGSTRRGPPPLISSNGTDSASTSPTPSPLSGNLSDKVEDSVGQPDVATRLNPADMMGMNRRGGGGRKRGVKEMKDDEDDEEDEGDDGEGDCEKTVPEDVNPERLKAFNVFVRLFVDENLDRLVPISKQPKEKVLAIIHACHRQFPEFHDRARKRIRTYLKSCRRMKKPNEPLRRTADQINAVPSMSSAQMQEVNNGSNIGDTVSKRAYGNILASACANEASLGERTEVPAVPTPAVPPVQPPTSKPSLMNGRAISPVETSRQSTSTMTSSSSTPPAPRPLVSPMTRIPLSAVAPESLAAARAKAGAEYKLNTTEVTAIRQLIASYRESAAFLYRSADELEALLPTSMLQPQKAVR